MSEYYMGYYTNSEVLKKSSSGGAFSYISDYFLKLDNCVLYGCVMDDDFVPRHIRGTTVEDRNHMRSSKYVGSFVGDSYKEVAADLLNSKTVLFSGTPCQISALLNFLKLKKINDNNLFTIEILCHGVASLTFFQDYIKNLENKYHSKAISCNFRGKHLEGQKQDMEISFANGKTFHSPSTKYDWFYSLYNNKQSYIIRPSCFECNYKSQTRIADFTIADSWKKDIDHQICSVIMCNSKKATTIWNELDKSNFIFQSISVNDIRFPSHYHKAKDYQAFWKIYNEKGYISAQKFVGNTNLTNKIKIVLVKMAFALNMQSILKRNHGKK